KPSSIETRRAESMQRAETQPGVRSKVTHHRDFFLMVARHVAEHAAFGVADERERERDAATGLVCRWVPPWRRLRPVLLESTQPDSFADNRGRLAGRGVQPRSDNF